MNTSKILKALGIIIIFLIIILALSAFWKSRQIENAETRDISGNEAVDDVLQRLSEIPGEIVDEFEDRDLKVNSITVNGDLNVKKDVNVEGDVNAETVNAETVNAEKIECKGDCCPKCAAKAPVCQNECSAGQRRCAPGCLTGDQYQTCGQHDGDSCLEWSPIQICPAGQKCENGQCVSPPPVCQNECYGGQAEGRCSGNFFQKRTCGSYDADNCMDWSGWQNDQNCGNDIFTSNYRCSGNWIQREVIRKGCSGNSCYSYSEWQNYQNCDGTCQNGICIRPPDVTTR